MSSAAVRDVLYKHFEQDGTLDRILERGEEKAKRNTAHEMIKDCFPPDKIARYVQKPLEWVENLINAPE